MLLRTSNSKLFHSAVLGDQPPRSSAGNQVAVREVGVLIVRDVNETPNDAVLNELLLLLLLLPIVAGTTR
jgi:hypothetical protein